MLILFWGTTSTLHISKLDKEDLQKNLDGLHHALSEKLGVPLSGIDLNHNVFQLSDGLLVTFGHPVTSPISEEALESIEKHMESIPEMKNAHIKDVGNFFLHKIFFFSNQKL